MDQVAARFDGNLRSRAHALARAVRAGQVNDVVGAAEASYLEERRALDRYVKSYTWRRGLAAILLIAITIALAVIAGVQLQSVVLSLLIFGLGAAITSRLLPDTKAVDGARQIGRERFDSLLHEELIAPARQSLREWQAAHPHPLVQTYGVSPAGAEQWVCDWMVHMGAEGASVTRSVGDGGIDVESDRFIAQVKHYTGTVGVGSIREHIGVASIDALQRTPLFFTSGAYAAGAVQAANHARMPLFTYDVTQGTVIPVNAQAHALTDIGFNPRWWPKS